MRKIILMMSVSLDGFFETADRDISWHLVDDELLRLVVLGQGRPLFEAPGVRMDLHPSRWHVVGVVVRLDRVLTDDEQRPNAFLGV